MWAAHMAGRARQRPYGSDRGPSGGDEAETPREASRDRLTANIRLAAINEPSPSRPPARARAQWESQSVLQPSGRPCVFPAGPVPPAPPILRRSLLSPPVPPECACHAPAHPTRLVLGGANAVPLRPRDLVRAVRRIPLASPPSTCRGNGCGRDGAGARSPTRCFPAPPHHTRFRRQGFLFDWSGDLSPPTPIAGASVKLFCTAHAASNLACGVSQHSATCSI